MRTHFLSMNYQKANTYRSALTAFASRAGKDTKIVRLSFAYLDQVVSVGIDRAEVIALRDMLNEIDQDFERGV